MERKNALPKIMRNREYAVTLVIIIALMLLASVSLLGVASCSSEIEIAYDDGEMDYGGSMGSNSGWGHGVLFDVGAPTTVTKITIYGHIYDAKPPFVPPGFGQTFDMEIRDSSLNNLFHSTYSYDDYFTKSYDWVIIDIPDVAVDGDFYIWVNTKSFQSPDMGKGIEIGEDSDRPSGNSFKIETTTDSILETWDSNWMIRAMVAGGSSVEPPEEIPTNLVVTVQSPSSDFSVLRGAPLAVSAKVTDNLENFVKASLVKATFTNGDDDQILLDDGLHKDGSADDGVYANTWTPQTTAQGYTETACTITVIASHGTLSQGSAYVSGEVISPPVSITIEDFGITPPTWNFPANGPITVGINDKIRIWYSIKNTDTSNRDVKLITKIRSQDTGEIIPDPTNDKVVTLSPSDTWWYSRSFVIPSGTKAGTYDVLYSIYKPDQSDIYDETWKAGWLIVDTDTYTVSLRSSTNDGSLNIGSIRVATATHNLPSEVTKQYRMSEYYYVEAIAPTGYNFDKWETIGGVSVNDIGNGFGILSVTGAGTLNAVLKKAPTFEIILDPSSILLNPGEKGSTLVNVKSLNGFSGSVELTLGWDEASSNWFSNVNFDPKIVTMTSGEQVISELSFDLSSSATPGVYNMHVGATDLQRQCQSKYENLQLIVKGTTTQDPVLENWEITPTMAKAGGTVELHYYIYNPNSQSLEVTLGVTMRDSNGKEMADEINDIDVTLTPGRNWYKRSFVIDATANTGYYDVMWGIHKAHLAGIYDKSGWQENRLEITTAKTLDDLLEAEQKLYENRRKMIEDYTRQMVCDYVYFDNNFDFNLFESAARTLTSMGIATIDSSRLLCLALAYTHEVISPDFKAWSNEEVCDVCWTDDTLYAKTLNTVRRGFELHDLKFGINDREKLAQIEKSHKEYVEFINNKVSDKDRNELELIINEQISVFNSNMENTYLVDNNPLMPFHNLLDINSEVQDQKHTYHIRTFIVGSVGCIGLAGVTVLTGGLTAPVAAAVFVPVCGVTWAAVTGSAEAITDWGLEEKMLIVIVQELNEYNSLLDDTADAYSNIISNSKLALEKTKHSPKGKLLSVDIPDIKLGETSPLILKFSNLGSSNLQANGYFDIYKKGEYFATLETPQYTIVRGNTEDLSASFSPPSDGEYAIYGYVIYENIRTEKLATQISVAPVTGAIVVNTNNANAKFTIIGLQSFSGDGSSWRTTEALIGTYKIIFDSIEGYDTPPSQELVLTPDSTITFTGDYIQQTITYSITLNSNSADIPLIVDGKVIYHDELPKTFTWSKNSEHTIKAQTEVYKDASTKYVFVKWDDGNTDSERTITVNSDKTYNAEYKTRYYLSLKTNPENIGTVFGAGWYDVNSPAEITAPVITGYAFTGWTVDDSTVVGDPIMISMDSPHNAVANYVSTDTSLPTVIDKAPTGSDVTVNTPITISFSEAMNQESAQLAFSTSPATIGSFSWSVNTMAYTPGSNLVSDTTYTVTVGTGATDLTGNNLQSPYSWQFTTASIEPKLCTNTIGMEFVLIPAGEFEMGSPSDEVGRYDAEGPVHHVNIEKAFYMCKYEVTQKQWREIMGNNPSYFKGDGNLPVEQVPWDDVQEFIKKLNEKEGTDKYRLPSEAEWEYACRAGTATRYSFGDSESNLGDYAWYWDNSGPQTHPVGQKKPNPWELYDMHGNVWEWVQDCWHSDYNGAPTDGSAWVVACKYDGTYRVVRGGSWTYYARDCRSAFRIVPRFRRGADLGFRLLKEV